jgi:hypothetical protein
MADLKSIRTSAQEILEDDATGKGSSSRFAMVAGIVTVCVCLFAAVTAHLCGVKDMEKLIEKLLVAVSGSGTGAYGIKSLMGVFNKGTSDGAQANQGGNV